MLVVETDCSKLLQFKWTYAVYSGRIDGRFLRFVIRPKTKGPDAKNDSCSSV